MTEDFKVGVAVFIVLLFVFSPFIVMMNSPNSPEPIKANYVATILKKEPAGKFTNAVVYTPIKKLYCSDAEYNILEVGKTYDLVIDDVNTTESTITNIVALKPEKAQ